MPNFRPIFLFANNERAGNGQVFATEAEALASAGARFQRWTMPIGFEAEATDLPVTYRWDDGDINIAATALYEKAGTVLSTSA